MLTLMVLGRLGIGMLEARVHALLGRHRHVSSVARAATHLHVLRRRHLINKPTISSPKHSMQALD